MDSVVHFEIPMDNAERAVQFYKSVFGWAIEEMTEMSYWIARTTEVDKDRMPLKPGAINGGMFKRSKPNEQLVIVVNVENPDSHLNKITKAGGLVIMPKMGVGDMGFYAKISDTEGNVIGVWQNRMK